MTTKICKSCKIEKDLDSFIYSPRNYTHGRCHECFKKEQNERNRERARRHCLTCQKNLKSIEFNSAAALCKSCEALNIKRCSRCNTCKPFDEFHISSTSSFGITSYCRLCQREINKKSYFKNNDTYKRRNKKYGKKVKKRMFFSAKSRAKKAGIPFNLELSDIVIPKCCPILGIKLKMSFGKVCYSSPSLDRIIPELGYVKGNIMVISWRANLIKNNGTIEIFEKIIDYIKKYTPKTNIDKIAENV